MTYDLDKHDEDIEFYLENDRLCPKCLTECDIDSSQSNERDSSNDRHYCPKCGWSCGETGVWLAEERIRERNKK